MSITASQVASATHLDAAESAFIARALTFVESTTYVTDIPPLKGRMLVPTKTCPPGAKFYNYVQITREGVAKWITAPGDDLPRTTLFREEASQALHRVGASYGYSIDDLLAAQMSNANGVGGPPINIDMEEALAARIAIEKKIDNVVRVGTSDGDSPDLGLTGLLNNPNATIYSVANGAAGSPLWSTKTPDEIAADITGIASDQVAGTYDVEHPSRILLSIERHEYIANRRMGDGSNVSIKDFVLQTSPWIKEILPWQFLSTAGSGSTQRMVAYNPDPMKLFLVMAQEFTQLPPQYRNMTYLTECTAKTGGVIVVKPLSLSYADGF